MNVSLKQKDISVMNRMEIKDGADVFKLARVKKLIGNGRCAMSYSMWIDRFTHYYTDGYYVYATKGTVDGIEVHIAPYSDKGSPRHLISSTRAFTELFKGAVLYSFVEEQHIITRKVLKRLGATQDENDNTKFTIEGEEYDKATIRE